MSSLPDLAFFARRLSWRAKLGAADIAAVAALPHVRRHVNATTYLVREGEAPRQGCSLVIDGLAFRHKLTTDGA